jgi:hypothetical protein
VPDDISFAWPAAGAMQVTPLPGGGCNIKITFPGRGIVRAIGTGRILKVRNVPTKRIARQYEIIIRHAGDFESSYSIVDQTPHLAAGDTLNRRTLGTSVESGDELYDIRDGGLLHFQLFQGGKLVDPRQYIQAEFDGTIDPARPSSET